MTSEWAILCKLGGFVNSNPEIISSFPNLPSSNDESEILSKCLPIGSKVGEFIVDKYNKYNLLSYIFKVIQSADRDDLFSLSVLLHKRDKTEIYMPALKELVNILDGNGLLSEEILTKYHRTIYEGINEEKRVLIEDLRIDFSIIFKEIKAKILKQKPNLKGSFF